VTDTYIYDAFGNLLTKTGTTANDFLYTGEQYDINTGFYYLRARYMNPATGTFTSMDAYAGTIFDPVSLHKYLYANANPVMNRDPSGYFTLTEMEMAVAIQAIVGAALNSIPIGISRLLNAAPLDGNFWLTFTGDFALGATMGLAFGWLGFLATKYLLACCLLRSIFGTMGLGFTWNFIQDVSNGDWGRAVLNAFGAITSFLGASTNFYQGGGLGNHGGGSSSGVVADDAAGAADDVAGKGNTGRASNNIRPAEDAIGAHTGFKRDPKTGEITNYRTYEPNPKNPSGFDQVSGYDGVGHPHRNAVTREPLMPHVHDRSAPGGVRVPRSDEIPGYMEG
jgi:RHS repeat-associated protein